MSEEPALVYNVRPIGSLRGRSEGRVVDASGAVAPQARSESVPTQESPSAQILLRPRNGRYLRGGRPIR